MHHRCHRSPLQGLSGKWVHEKRGHGSPRLLLFLVTSMSGLLVHTRAGGDCQGFSGGLSRGFCIYTCGRTGFSSRIKLFFTVRVGRESATRCSAEVPTLIRTAGKWLWCRPGVEGLKQQDHAEQQCPSRPHKQ